MKKTIKSALVLLALGASALACSAQDTDGPPPGEGSHGHHRPPSPLFAALDANHDGVIDATEIVNASAALKTLDKNNDGQLTMDELMPPRPEGTNNAAGPHGFGKGGHHPPMPLMEALDTNHDGVIDANEIANASAALKTLDKNNDGQLTRDELMPRWEHHRHDDDNVPGQGGPPPEQDK